MDFESILYEVQDGIAKITLNRPQAFNALNMEMFQEVYEAVSAADSDPQVRVLLITGAGRAFCAGGDIKVFQENIERSSWMLKRMTAAAHNGVSRIARMRKPSVAVINGTVAGGGFGLAFSTDLAIAAESAKFNMAYTALAVSPDNSSSYFVPRLIGLRRAMELALLNRELSAAEALDWGLLNRVVPDDELAAEAEKLARKLARGPTEAFGATKRLFHQSFQTTLETQMQYEAESIAALSETEDFREAVAAFSEKRRPDFKGGG